MCVCVHTHICSHIVPCHILMFFLASCLESVLALPFDKLLCSMFCCVILSVFCIHQRCSHPCLVHTARFKNLSPGFQNLRDATDDDTVCGVEQHTMKEPISLTKFRSEMGNLVKPQRANVRPDYGLQTFPEDFMVHCGSCFIFSVFWILLHVSLTSVSDWLNTLVCPQGTPRKMRNRAKTIKQIEYFRSDQSPHPSERTRSRSTQHDRNIS